MRSFLMFVVIVAFTVICGLSVSAANKESVGEKPSSESSLDTTASKESSSPTNEAEEKPEILATCSSGAVRLEQTGEDIWAVLVGNPAERAKLPKVQILGDWSYPNEFDCSPDDQWIFAPYHVGSCLRAAVLYHRTSATSIDVREDFEEMVWRNAAKLKLIKANYQAEGFCAMVFFAGWSADSGRVLIGLLGGEDKRDLDHCYIDFNTRTRKFESTNYLRKVSTTKSPALACAEPIDLLPPEAQLKTRLEMLDKQLNDSYSAKISKIDKDRVQNFRESQRSWLKARDKGLQLYLSVAPPSERERRKLQFLADVTAARIESLNESEEEPFDFWERISEKANE